MRTIRLKRDYDRFKAGDLYDTHDVVADAWIRRGIAEPFTEVAKATGPAMNPIPEPAHAAVIPAAVAKDLHPATPVAAEASPGIHTDLDFEGRPKDDKGTAKADHPATHAEPVKPAEHKSEPPLIPPQPPQGGRKK